MKPISRPWNKSHWAEYAANEKIDRSKIEVKNTLVQVQFELSKWKISCNFETTLYSAEINQIFQVL